MVALFAASVTTAPSNPTPTSTIAAGAAPDDDPLDTSESGHFRRKRIWRTLLKQLYGLGGYGLDLLSGSGHFQGHHHGHSHGHSHGHNYGYQGVKAPGGYGGGGYGYPVADNNGHANYAPAPPVTGGYYGGGNYNGGYGLHDFSWSHGGSVPELGLWGNSWGVLDGYGLGGHYGGLHSDDIWL
ncbi:hypothetical protein J6590_007172 [Homalodisca vitripennis]|nr:hypothetical protein J6590_007172 [Homalodisca vitripennis]